MSGYVRARCGHSVRHARRRGRPSRRELLRDSFTRLIRHVDDLTDDLGDEKCPSTGPPLRHTSRPTASAGSFGAAPASGRQLAHIAGIDQVWFSGGWVDRFALDLPRDAHGYVHTPRRSAGPGPGRSTFAGYYHAVHKMSLEYVKASPPTNPRVVDTNWNPPVTAVRGWSASSTTAPSTWAEPPPFEDHP